MERLDQEQWYRIFCYLPLEERLRYYTEGRWKSVIDEHPDLLLSNTEILTPSWDAIPKVPHPMNDIVIDAQGVIPKAPKLLEFLPRVRRIVLVLDEVTGGGKVPNPAWYTALIDGLKEKLDTTYVFLFPAVGGFTVDRAHYHWAILQGGVYYSPMPFPSLLPGLTFYQDEGMASFASRLCTSILSPKFYSFLCSVELGLVDPTKPPGPDNPRLKDALSLFSTRFAVPGIVEDLASIAITIDDARGTSRARDLAMEMFYPLLQVEEQGEGTTPEAFRRSIARCSTFRRGTIDNPVSLGSFGRVGVTIPLFVALEMQIFPPLESDHLFRLKDADVELAYSALRRYSKTGGKSRRYLEDGTTFLV